VFYAPCRVIDNHVCESQLCSETCFKNSEFAPLEPEILLYSLKKGFRISKEIFSTKRTFCGANTMTLFVMDSYANLLKCWCNLGNTENNNVGYIDNAGDTVFTDYNVLAKWMAWDPFTLKECLNCKVLPVCMGGCMYYNVIGETDRVEVGCSILRHNIAEILQVYYLSVSKSPAELQEINFVDNRIIKAA